MSAGVGDGRRAARGQPLPGGAGRSSTSIGMPMCTGRGRRDSKISKARAKASGRSAGSRTSIDSAVIVAMNARWSGRSCSVPWPRPLSRARGGARDDEHRDRVVVGAGDRRRGVREAGAGDQRADAGLARDARVAVGHERRALLVARRDVADLGGREAAVDLERVHARDAEHGVDAVLLEQADDRLAAARRGGRRGAGVNGLQVAWLRPCGERIGSGGCPMSP